LLPIVRRNSGASKPTGKVDASLGDVHPEGISLWLDPENGIIIASNILAALKSTIIQQFYYDANTKSLKTKLKKGLLVGRQRFII